MVRDAEGGGLDLVVPGDEGAADRLVPLSERAAIGLVAQIGQWLHRRVQWQARVIPPPPD